MSLRDLRLRPVAILCVASLLSLPASAQTGIPGGANSNPSTSDGPGVPPDLDKPSSDDGSGSPGDEPESPGATTPEGKKSCEAEDEKETPDGPPTAPGSVELTFSLQACPLEYSVSTGSLRLYFDKPVENMGDPVHLEYHSVAGAKIGQQTVEGLPSGVLRRFTVNQLSGKPLAFELRSGDPVMKPYGSGARSRARAELRTAGGAITTDPDQATSLRQYRSAGGYMEFNLATGKIQHWAGPTGRGLDFPVDPEAGAAAMGLEVIRVSGKIRQIKSPAGLLDVVPDADGRGYRVMTYLPSQVGTKGSELYPVAEGGRPRRTVEVRHPLGTAKLISVHTDHSPDGTPDLVRTLTHEYIDTFDGGHEWSLTTAADGISLTSSRHMVPDHDSPGMRRVVREVKDGTGKLIFRKEMLQKFEFSWDGWTDVQEIETPGGDTALKKVRAFRYGVDPGGNDFRKLKWQMTETGLTYEYVYDAAGRMTERRSPWLDGAGGLFRIEKFSYEPHAPGEAVLPGDGRPRTTTVEVGVPGATGNPLLSRSYFAAYYDAANGGRHTVVNEDAATPSAGYGAPGNRRRTRIFNPAGSFPGSGRLAEEINELGLRTVSEYALSSGGGLVETVTGPLLVGGSGKAGSTRKTVTEKDQAGRTLKVRESIFDGSGYVELHEDQFMHAPQGQLTGIVRTDLKSGRQRSQASYQWQGEQMSGQTSEDGSIVTKRYDGFGRLTRSSVGAVPAVASPLGGAAYPARPEIVEETAGGVSGGLDSVEWGGEVVTTTTAGSLACQSTAVLDAAGREITRTDANGYSTATSYLNRGLEKVATRPDGGTVRTVSYPDGRIRERSGNGIVPEYYSYSINAGGGLTTRVHFALPNGPRYRATTMDMLGRTVGHESPGYGGITVTVTHSFLSGSSRPVRVASSAAKVPLQVSEYDSFGELVRQGSTLRPSAVAPDPSSPDDRVQESESAVAVDAEGVWLVQRAFLYPHEGAQAAKRYLRSETRSKLAGFTGNTMEEQATSDGAGNWQSSTVETDPASRLTIQRTRANAFTGEAVAISHGGLAVESRKPADTASTLVTYDALGRETGRKEARHAAASVTAYAAGTDLVATQTDASGATVSYEHVPQGVPGAGRVAAVTYPDTGVTRRTYDLRGNVIREWGSATTPTAYGYNAYRQLETLSTYRVPPLEDTAAWAAPATAPDVTTWVYEEATGLLLQKQHADGKGPLYQYDAAGRLSRRTSARGTVTDYAYTSWGELDTVDYGDTTPDVNLDYDRIGRKKIEGNGVASTAFQYSGTTLQLSSETIRYDLDLNGTPELERELVRNSDALRRPAGYLLRNGTAVEMQATYGYDAIGRLAMVSGGIPSAPESFTYEYQGTSGLIRKIVAPSHTVTNTWEANRDVLASKENKVAATVVSAYGYSVDESGRRTAVNRTGTAFGSGGTTDWTYDKLGQVTAADSSVAGQDRAYEYDAMGNRRKAADSLILPGTDGYTANSLNQYTAVAALNPVYDDDGNATAYPLPADPGTNATLAWDGENRLKSATVGGVTVQYFYDAQSRRIARVQGGATTFHFYNGWNCIAEYTGGSLAKRYLWGLDLSGTKQGAGGVGGLLALGSGASSHHPVYDGNGNVSEYLTPAGTVAAHFEYDPFGRTTVDTDTAGNFDIRFSTKPRDAATGLYYYGYRFYDPAEGRWPSRDPIGERGGVNLYAAAGNCLVDDFDTLGLRPRDTQGGIVETLNPSPSVPSGPTYQNAGSLDMLLENIAVAAGTDGMYNTEFEGDEWDGWLDETKFLEKHFPKLTNAMKERARNVIRKQVEDAICKGKGDLKPSDLPFMAVQPFVLTPNPSEFDKNDILVLDNSFGDIPMAFFNATVNGLGSFSFIFEQKDISVTDTGEQNGCRTYHWETKVDFRDVLGGDVVGFDLHVSRGKFDIEGNFNCCDCPE